MRIKNLFQLSQNTASLFGLVILAALIIAISLPIKNQLAPTKADTSPDWYMTGVSTVNYDAQGKVSGTLTAPKVVHFKRDDVANLTQPFFTLYDKNDVPWHITSAYGKFFQGKDEHFFLWGNVIVKELPAPHSSQTKLTTEQLTYYPKTSYAHTDKAVTITQPGSIMHSIGFNANLKKGLIQFLSQSTAEYDNAKAQ